MLLDRSILKIKRIDQLDVDRIENNNKYLSCLNGTY